MKYKHTIEIITKDIQDIEKLIRNFSNYSKIPAIELDLALAKLRNLYEVLSLLRHEEPNVASNYENPTKEIQKDHIPDKSSNTENILESDAFDLNEEENEPGIVQKQAENEKKTTKSSKDDIQKKEIDENTRKEKILAEKLENGKLFINEKLAKDSSSSDLSSKLQSKPITSIAGSMGINDKFFFIRELFNGDADKFRETCIHLDETANFKDAYNYLDKNFEWDMNEEIVKQLLNLVKRKLITRENE